MTTLFTIGYGNRSVNTFINLLSEYEIEILIDVRSFPYSRFNPSYNRKALQGVLQCTGVEYHYKGDALGGKPKDETLYINGKLNYYAIGNTSIYKAAINELLELAEGKNICLMCSELNPDNCHRKNLIGETLVKQNVSVRHINERGLLSAHPNFLTLDLF